ncbi:hypothetical protein BOTBODRAFT_45547 [Botryobasidium botryosum FD-172 SS1]|uniref:Protein kinase domain-containing protein n=1 Tax=Botryobasidium botryosum (strain FD-172 SS1) TaxID=930990 RepID=A0A067ME01_BOTB1|nr:hypothetical protein BOTBODRAFT_45547 [Botryobasidium botryosum FD-172 SS1]
MPEHPQPLAHRAPPPPAHNDKEPVAVMAVPAMTPAGTVLVDNAHSQSLRSYTPLKVVGDGSFGTVWLCDWHSTLPPNTMLSPMQCGAGARPEWHGKRLVAVKRMKKQWEGGWEECRKLKELESLRVIPPHPNIIPLYDYFLLPATRELYFVFECMEGNLYQLIKSRKGRPLAGGLVSSIFRQVVVGLHHIHSSGYFHRDMKPENLLVTTTGLQDYAPTSPIAPPNAPPEKDVVVIVKLADFGLARETASAPPYTEYVSTRWYRAPEVLLRSREYSNPVDMWALGTILAELVNLKPLFPGSNEVDQVMRICEVLGDPGESHGTDERRRTRGGGKWSKGVKMGRAVGFTFPKLKPMNFYDLFERSVPLSLIDCIADLLRYEPSARLTTQDCINHAYVHETSPFVPAANFPQFSQYPPTTSSSTSTKVDPTVFSKTSTAHSSGSNSNFGSYQYPYSHPHLSAVPPRGFPDAHASSPYMGRRASMPINTTNLPQMQAFYPTPSSSNEPQLPRSAAATATATLAEQMRELDLPKGMRPDQLPVSPPSSSVQSAYVNGHINGNANGYGDAHPPVAQAQTMGEYGSAYYAPHGLGPVYEAHHMHETNGVHPEHARMDVSKHEQNHHSVPPQQQQQQQQQPQQGSGNPNKFGLLGLGFGKSKKPKAWGGLFGVGDAHNKHHPNGHSLPPVEEIIPSSSSTPSLKRTQSTSTTDSRSLPDLAQLGVPTLHAANSSNGGGVAVSRVSSDPKKARKEQERLQKEAEREAEKVRRAEAVQRQKEISRSVGAKRNMEINRLMATGDTGDLMWQSTSTGAYAAHRGSLKPDVKGKHPVVPPPAFAQSQQQQHLLAQQQQQHLLQQKKSHQQMRMTQQHSNSPPVSFAAQKRNHPASDFSPTKHPMVVGSNGASGASGMVGMGASTGDHRLTVDDYNRSKARRRDLDDDHSMSSADIHSVARMSISSHATVDSDPGPGYYGGPGYAGGSRSRLRANSTAQTRVAVGHSVTLSTGSAHTHSMNRAASHSSLRSTSGRGFSPSARSSNSLEAGFINEFNEHANLSMGDVVASPLQMHMLSLSSPSPGSASPSPNGGWPSPNGSDGSSPYHMPGSPLPAPTPGHATPPIGQNRRLHPPSSYLPPISSVTPPPPPISQMANHKYQSHQREGSVGTPGQGGGDHYRGQTNGDPQTTPNGKAVHTMFQVPHQSDQPYNEPTPHGTLPPFSQFVSLVDQQHMDPRFRSGPP